MVIAGIAFDTVGGPGPRWHDPWVDSPEGFIVRHPRRLLSRERTPFTLTAIESVALGTNLLLPGDRPRCAAGHRRAVPDLEPRPRGDRAVAVRLGHPPERRILPRLPRRHPLRDRDRPLLLLPRRLEADLPRPRPLAARPLRRRRRRRPARLGDRRRHDPRRDPRPGAGAQAAPPLRLADLGGDLPHDQRRPAAGLRALPPPPAASRRLQGRRRRAGSRRWASSRRWRSAPRRRRP